MESGVGLAPKEVCALSHALFPDAEPQCRTGDTSGPVQRLRLKGRLPSCRSDLGAAASSIVMAARSRSASRLIVDDRLDHCDIHTRTRRDPLYFGRHLGMLIGNGPDSRSAVSDFNADAMRLIQDKRLEFVSGSGTKSLALSRAKFSSTYLPTCSNTIEPQSLPTAKTS